ncbi:hypothetical protein BdWA1_001068 [Babesia duncani]|nr:hypothetical protein BdWA1_001068 [Babesia duncani]
MSLSKDSDKSPDVVVFDVSSDDAVSEKIIEYGNNVISSLKSTLSYTIQAGNQATSVLSKLSSQQGALNEAHSNVTATQAIVESLSSSVNWIKKSIPWLGSDELNIVDLECSSPTSTSQPSCILSNLLSKVIDSPEVVANRKASNGQFMHGSLGTFSMNASSYLDDIITEMQSNQNKTMLIADVVNRQNEDLKRISESALALGDRVNRINKVLTSHGNA